MTIRAWRRDMPGSMKEISFDEDQEAVAVAALSQKLDLEYELLERNKSGMNARERIESKELIEALESTLALFSSDVKPKRRRPNQPVDTTTSP